MVFFNKENLEKLKKKGKYVLVAAAVVGTISLTGCSATELSTNNNVSYDTIDTTDTEALEEGITQVLDVPGEDFKLVVQYKCELQEDERWTVTSDKQLNMEVRTDSLPSDTKVYIDNIHTDTTICSYYPQIDGITQDTMDDRIHNSLMIGFSISDSNPYSGINQIQGQNDTFIQGFVRGYNGYTNGSIEEKRFLESDYLEKGVNANKISSIIDLIIIRDNEERFTSVKSEVQVSVWPYIQMQKDNGEIYYKYYYLNKDGEMTYDELSQDEYLIQTQIDSKKLTK